MIVAQAPNLPNRNLVSSVGGASDCCAGGLGFETETGPTLRVFKKN